MKPLTVSQDILTIGNFKSHAASVLRSVRESGRAVVLTQHGRPAGVLVSPEDYDRLVARERFASAVERGLADAEAGRTVSDDELGAELDRAFGPLQA